MDKTSPMKSKPLVDCTCKLGTKGCFEDGRCHALGNCENKIVTNADRIRAMSDELLATQLVRVFCEGVKLLTEIDVPDEIADEFRNSVLKRLKQPAEE